MKVELIYDRDCPNVKAARKQLLSAFSLAGISPSWIEWDRAAMDNPQYVRRFGSPTILVDEQDVDPDNAAPSASCCRLYLSRSGTLSGVPQVEHIASALSRSIANLPVSEAANGKKSWRMALAATPTFGVVLLPKLTCAACWPAYTAVLSALGFSFFDYTAYLLPITVAALALTLMSLGWRAKARWGYGPLALGIAAALTHLIGKFVFDSNFIAYAAVPTLIGAAVWNAWPRMVAVKSCGSCASSDA